MSFHISAWSIKNPVPTIVTFLVLGIVGFASFLGLGIDSSPNVDIPSVMVTVTQRGTGPAELESQVTKEIEDAVAGLGNIKEISSTVTDGTSETIIEFTLGTDSDRATNDVRNAIAQIRQDLPQDISEPVVQRLEFAGGSIVTYVVNSDRRSVEELSDIVDQEISRALLKIPGVAQVDRSGGVEREIRVDLDPSRLQAYNITATQVNEQIRNNVNLSGGRTEIGGSEQNVRTLGSAQSVAQLQSYPIVLPSGATVPLSSLGTVEDSFAEPRQSAFLNGEPAVAFAVRRSPGSTLVTVEEKVHQVIESLRTTLPEIKLRQIFTLADDIRASYQGTISALILGCLLTVVTVGIFLRDWRPTLITALALPLSIVPTFAVMKALDYTLNSMTLLALALAVGNLVDDAICTIENIDRHLQIGKKPYQAALDGAREIGLAVVATTATIVAVFLPVAFMGGIPGQFFQPFGITVSVSTLFSTLVAVTITPMLSAYLLKPKQLKVEASPFNLQPLTLPSPNLQPSTFQPYRRFLTWALRHRITTLLVAIAFFIGSLQLLPFIPKGLFDSGDTGISTVLVELPPGSKLSDTEAVTQQINELLQAQPAVASVFTTVGDSDINSATMVVNLVPKEDRELTRQQFEQAMREAFSRIPGVRISFRSQGVGGASKDLSIVLKGDDPQTLDQAANALETQMREIPSLVEVVSSTSLVKPEMIIEPNLERAADLGVSVEQIARTASLALIGDRNSDLAKFDLGDRQIPIRVQIEPQQRSNLDTLRNLRVPSSSGAKVPLSAVANLRLGSGPAEIERFNRSRQVRVEANLQGISLGDAMAKIKALPAMNPLPPGIAEEPDGDAEIMGEVFSRFLGALGLAILAIYAILVLLYNNFLYPLGILAALPLSVGGALLGLLVTQKELGLFALIGVVLLMGLVTKNAILLVDFALAGVKQGKPPFHAVVEAGVSRLRPILMTSLSTIAGMLPIALELGADGETRSPMAIAVIGGFTTSTLLTLVVVPVIFTYINNFWLRLRQLLGGEGNREQGTGNRDY